MNFQHKKFVSGYKEECGSMLSTFSGFSKIHISEVTLSFRDMSSLVKNYIQVDFRNR